MTISTLPKTVLASSASTELPSQFCTASDQQQCNGNNAPEITDPQNGTATAALEVLTAETRLPTVKGIENAAERLQGVARRTPLTHHDRLSQETDAHVFLKREDLQDVRSYKIRGAYNAMALLTEEERANGIVCASAGNHAQGVAFACKKLGIHGTIFMPATTPRQKIDAVRKFGGEFITIKIGGDDFDQAYQASKEYCSQKQAKYIPPFDDAAVIEGQGTVAAEVLQQAEEDPKFQGNIDYIIVPIGGGGLISGTLTYLKERNPNIKVIGVESEGYDCMRQSLAKDHPVELPGGDPFVEGTAVKTPGKIPFAICQEAHLRGQLDKVLTIETNAVCAAMEDYMENDGIIIEPSGALSIAALKKLNGNLQGKNVVCIISGGNCGTKRLQDVITRGREFKERHLRHEGEIHMPGRSFSLHDFLSLLKQKSLDLNIVEFHFSEEDPEPAAGLRAVQITFKAPNDDESSRLLTTLENLPSPFSWHPKAA